VRSPKKFNVHRCQKVPFVLACFLERVTPFGVDTQITFLLSSGKNIGWNSTQLHMNCSVLCGYFITVQVVIKEGTKFIKALSDIFKKIAQIGRFYFEKCHHVTYNLFK
jgi:hypothetical protein